MPTFCGFDHLRWFAISNPWYLPHRISSERSQASYERSHSQHLFLLNPLHAHESPASHEHTIIIGTIQKSYKAHMVGTARVYKG